jgi:hypothetical protein
LWANSDSNSHRGWKSISDGHSYAYPDSPGDGYTNSASYGYTDSKPVVHAVTDNNALRLE